MKHVSFIHHKTPKLTLLRKTGKSLLGNLDKKGEAKRNTDDNPTTHVFACWLHQAAPSMLRKLLLNLELVLHGF